MQKQRLALRVLFLAPLLAAALWVWHKRTSPGQPIVPTSFVVGNIRVQVLSPTLIRIEERGPQGFEDRGTFNVVNRAQEEAPLVRTETADLVKLTSPTWRIEVPTTAARLEQVRVLSLEGAPLLDFSATQPQDHFLPDPGAMPAAWLMWDHPRVVPAAWGAAPVPEPLPYEEHAGWDLTNPAKDAYVFVPGAGGYRQLRADYIRLTGPVPLPPLFTFGYWTSRWHPYSEQSALEEVDRFRQKQIPLDVFVVDTDWRLGASHGYAVNPAYFPDMPRFIQKAHERNVRLMFNDHPEPQGPALSQHELQVRWDGLTSLLKEGADVWWYDRNWTTELAEPVPGLKKEVWGMRVYHDITQRFRPQQRPLIMSNVQGVDNGFLKRPSAPAAHRYPIWWTGDTYAVWPFLEHAVHNAVSSGVTGVLPYVHDDCGGFALRSFPELQVRYMQFCAMAPVLRTHAAKNKSRLPWDFDATTERLATDYIRLRYRLLPTLYAAARRAFDDATPLLRRGDLEWPQWPDAADNSRFLLGDDLWVAPVMQSMQAEALIPDGQLTHEGKPGVRAELFTGGLDANRIHDGRTQNVLFHGWPLSDGRPVPGGLAFRWTTRWENIPETGEYLFHVAANGYGRLLLNGKQVVQDKDTVNDVLVPVTLQQGAAVDVVLEHAPMNMTVHAELNVVLPSARKKHLDHPVWIPPGEWEDAWTGQRVQGPQTLVRPVAWHELPLWMRGGGVVLTLPTMQHTAERPWDLVVADAYVPTAPGRTERELYEDDGISTAYLDGAWRRTPVGLERSGQEVLFTVGAARGDVAVGPAQRAWVVRLHLPPQGVAHAVEVNGKACTPGTTGACVLLEPAPQAPTLLLLGQGARPPPQAGPVVEVHLDTMGVKDTARIRVLLAP